MIKNYVYITVVKQIENGKYLLTFPDFEGITTTVESEENISEMGANIIKMKLSELKKAGIKIPEPLKIKDISMNLKKEEFTTFITISNFDFDFKDISVNKENLKEFPKKIEKFVKDDVKSFIPKGKENMLSIVGGILFLINTLFLSVIVINIPFIGKYKIGFFKGLSEFSKFSKEASKASVLLMIVGVILAILSVILIYFGYIKNKVLIKYTVFTKIIFLILFYIILLFKIPKEVSNYISLSYFKILIYIISLALAYISYLLIENDSKDRNISEEK